MSALTLQGAMALMGCLVIGLGVGAAYFGAMWWSATLFAAGGRVRLASTLIAGRFALIIAVLALVASRGGALPLLATALGIAAARALVMRRVKALAVAP